jgi:hypothetical protein
MNMKTPRIVATFLLSIATMSAMAQGPGWTASSTVVTLIVTQTGGVNVRLSPELTGCTSQSGYGPRVASIYPNHPGIDRMKASLLAAQVSGTPVMLYLIDSDCTVGEMAFGGSW